MILKSCINPLNGYSWSVLLMHESVWKNISVEKSNRNFFLTPFITFKFCAYPLNPNIFSSVSVASESAAGINGVLTSPNNLTIFPNSIAPE